MRSEEEIKERLSRTKEFLSKYTENDRHRMRVASEEYTLEWVLNNKDGE